MEVMPGPGGARDLELPFQRRNVEEWTHRDALTGAIGKARRETNHWAVNTDSAQHNYGKVVDQRALNLADGRGRVQQLQRKQLEVFSTRVPGGTMQVIRSSTTSSSRAMGPLAGVGAIGGIGGIGATLPGSSTIGDGDPFRIPFGASLAGHSVLSQLGESRLGTDTGASIFEDLQLALHPLDLSSEKTKAIVGRSIGSRRPPTRVRPPSAAAASAGAGAGAAGAKTTPSGSPPKHPQSQTQPKFHRTEESINEASRRYSREIHIEIEKSNSTSDSVNEDTAPIVEFPPSDSESSGSVRNGYDFILPLSSSSSSIRPAKSCSIENLSSIDTESLGVCNSWSSDNGLGEGRGQGERERAEGASSSSSSLWARGSRLRRSLQYTLPADFPTSAGTSVRKMKEDFEGKRFSAANAPSPSSPLPSASAAPGPGLTPRPSPEPGKERRLDISKWMVGEDMKAQSHSCVTVKSLSEVRSRLRRTTPDNSQARKQEEAPVATPAASVDEVSAPSATSPTPTATSPSGTYVFGLEPLAAAGPGQSAHTRSKPTASCSCADTPAAPSPAPSPSPAASHLQSLTPATEKSASNSFRSEDERAHRKLFGVELEHKEGAGAGAVHTILSPSLVKHATERDARTARAQEEPVPALAPVSATVRLRAPSHRPRPRPASFHEGMQLQLPGRQSTETHLTTFLDEDARRKSSFISKLDVGQEQSGKTVVQFGPLGLSNIEKTDFDWKRNQLKKVTPGEAIQEREILGNVTKPVTISIPIIQSNAHNNSNDFPARRNLVTRVPDAFDVELTIPINGVDIVKPSGGTRDRRSSTSTTGDDPGAVAAVAVEDESVESSESGNQDADGTDKEFGDDPAQARKKKVEFSKTEVHFAAEPGRFNLVATDDKPPPTHIIRGRRRQKVANERKFNRSGLPEVRFGDSQYEKKLLSTDAEQAEQAELAGQELAGPEREREQERVGDSGPPPAPSPAPAPPAAPTAQPSTGTTIKVTLVGNSGSAAPAPSPSPADTLEPTSFELSNSSTNVSLSEESKPTVVTKSATKAHDESSNRTETATPVWMSTVTLKSPPFEAPPERHTESHTRPETELQRIRMNLIPVGARKVTHMTPESSQATDTNSSHRETRSPVLSEGFSTKINLGPPKGSEGTLINEMTLSSPTFHDRPNRPLSPYRPASDSVIMTKSDSSRRGLRSTQLVLLAHSQASKLRQPRSWSRTQHEVKGPARALHDGHHVLSGDLGPGGAGEVSDDSSTADAEVRAYMRESSSPEHPGSSRSAHPHVTSVVLHVNGTDRPHFEPVTTTILIKPDQKPGKLGLYRHHASSAERLVERLAGAGAGTAVEPGYSKFGKGKETTQYRHGASSTSSLENESISRRDAGADILAKPAPASSWQPASSASTNKVLLGDNTNEYKLYGREQRRTPESKLRRDNNLEGQKWDNVVIRQTRDKIFDWERRGRRPEEENRDLESQKTHEASQRLTNDRVPHSTRNGTALEGDIRWHNGVEQDAYVTPFESRKRDKSTERRGQDVRIGGTRQERSPERFVNGMRLEGHRRDRSTERDVNEIKVTEQRRGRSSERDGIKHERRRGDKSLDRDRSEFYFGGQVRDKSLERDMSDIRWERRRRDSSAGRDRSDARMERQRDESPDLGVKLKRNENPKDLHDFCMGVRSNDIKSQEKDEKRLGRLRIFKSPEREATAIQSDTKRRERSLKREGNERLEVNRASPEQEFRDERHELRRRGKSKDRESRDKNNDHERMDIRKEMRRRDKSSERDTMDLRDERHKRDRSSERKIREPSSERYRRSNGSLEWEERETVVVDNRPKSPEAAREMRVRSPVDRDCNSELKPERKKRAKSTDRIDHAVLQKEDMPQQPSDGPSGQDPVKVRQGQPDWVDEPRKKHAHGDEAGREGRVLVERRSRDGNKLTKQASPNGPIAPTRSNRGERDKDKGKDKDKDKVVRRTRTHLTTMETPVAHMMKNCKAKRVGEPLKVVAAENQVDTLPTRPLRRIAPSKSNKDTNVGKVPLIATKIPSCKKTPSKVPEGSSNTSRGKTSQSQTHAQVRRQHSSQSNARQQRHAK